MENEVKKTADWEKYIKKAKVSIGLQCHLRRRRRTRRGGGGRKKEEKRNKKRRKRRRAKRRGRREIRKGGGRGGKEEEGFRGTLSKRPEGHRMHTTGITQF